MKRNPLTIMGAGPVGILLALYLAQRNYPIRLFEKRGDPSTHPAEGKSINLALSERGRFALKEIGLDQALLDQGVAMKGRMVHPQGNDPYFIPYSSLKNHHIYSISRRELTKLLLQKAATFPHIEIAFHQECLAVDLKDEKIELLDTQTHRKYSLPLSILFDAEGIGSPIRTSLLKCHYTNFSQEYLPFDYKELTIPSLQGKFQIEKEALHLWPRESHLMIALPNRDGTFTCTLFLPRNNFNALNQPEKVLEFFKNDFPDAFPLFNNLEEQFIKNPIGYLSTIKVSPWSFHNKILLMGDAAHGIVPFYGQGLNCGFEDCTFLNKCLEKHPDDWEALFHTYEEGRKRNTDAIAELSFDNFIELREKVADPAFVLKRQLERKLETLYPAFMSKYSMVTFSQIPYEEALIKGRRQDQILMEACSKVKTIEEIDLQALIKSIGLYN